MKRTTWIVLGWLVLGISANAASFDCAKAGTKVERLICGDAETSKLDEELNAAYKAALQEKTKADAIKKAQKQWLRERNACLDVDCLMGTYQARIHALTDTRAELSPLSVQPEMSLAHNEAASNADSAKDQTTKPDLPGYFLLDKSTNDNVCFPLAKMINADIKEYGRTRFDTHSEFLKWQKVEEGRIDRGEYHKYDGALEEANVDINNDGTIDQVIRTHWSIRGAFEDMLTVQPKYKQTLAVAELIKSDRIITFNPNNYWLGRYKRKYGDLNFDWVLTGVASIDLFRRNNETYVVAHNDAAPSNISAKIYVFQLDKEYRKFEENDVCMFVKICPCVGCEDLRGDEINKTLPAKKWCNK